MFQQAESLTISNLEAAALLIRVIPAQKLKPFFKVARTLSEASKELGVESSNLYYWIKKFMNLGLLTIAYEKKRAGSSMKYYQTPAKRFVMRLGKDLSPLSDYYGAANTAYCDDIVESKIKSFSSLESDIAVVIQTDNQGDINTTIVSLSEDEKEQSISEKMLRPNMPASYTGWYEMQLRFQDAKDFQRKLNSLMKEYESKIVQGQGRYLVQMAIVPLE